MVLTVNPSVLKVTSELVMLSLDLVKTRLSVMSMEMRKNFIQVILTSLIEKSPDPKILRAVVKIVEEWVKNNSPMAANQVRRRLFSVDLHYSDGDRVIYSIIAGVNQN